MKYLPLKLGVFVVLLFAAVITACLLYTPLRMRYYTAKLRSEIPEERVAAVDALLEKGTWGKKVLVDYYGCSAEEIDYVEEDWDYIGSDEEGNDPDYCPIQIAIQFKYLQAARLFIDKGANVNMRVDGVTTLGKAAGRNYKDIVALLIEKGADTNIKDANGNSPLHLAACNGHKYIASLLLDSSSNVNAKGPGRRTPLHYAAYYGHNDIVALLIARGAKLDAESRDGKTPLDLAIEYKHREIADLLRAHGGKTGEELRSEAEK